MPIRSLLEELHKIIERTYHMDTGLDAVSQFVIGDETYRRLYANKKLVTVVQSSYGAMVVVRIDSKPLRVSLYYPNRLIAKLEVHNPRIGVYDSNIYELSVFVEELDHLLLIAQNYKHRKPFSLLNLEVHANITKYLILSYLIASQRRENKLNPTYRSLLKSYLFESNRYSAVNPKEKKRYSEADRLSAKYVSYLENLPADMMLEELRRFDKLAGAELINHIERLS